MKWRRVFCAATLVVLALSAAGCAAPAAKTETQEAAAPDKSAPKSTTEQAEPETGGFGQYRLESDGAIVTVDIPAPSDDPEIRKVEKYRRRYKIKPYSYATVATDNSKGAKDAWIPGTIIVVTDSGKQVKYIYAADRVVETVESLGWDSKQQDAGMALYEELGPPDGGVVLPGALGKSIVAATEEPDGVKSVHWRSRNAQKVFTKVH